MTNLEKIENAIEFIEKNLKEDIHLDAIANEACTSKFHFHRLFHIAIGETLFDYIRKRRLSEAANEVLQTNLKIWEIASDYQFDSPEAFSRSFKKAYGKTPLKYRQEGKRIIYYGRVKLSGKYLKHYCSNLRLEPEIKEEDELVLSGRKLAVNRNNIDELIATLHEIDSMQEKPLNSAYPEIFEIHLFISGPDHYINHDMNSTFHRIVASRKELLKTLPDDFVTVKIPKGKYAVFAHKGKRADSYLTVDYIWGTWMMKNNIETDERFAYEYYGDKYLGPDNPESIIEYYLPIC